MNNKSKFLLTKINIPRVRSKIVLRTPLFNKLNYSIENSLTLVSAPAGFGKSTLISSWLSAAKATIIPAAWFSIDENDNDPIRFFQYFLAAIDKLIKLDSQLTNLIYSSEKVNFEYIMTQLINEIAEETKDFILVIDDYHIINNKEIHNAIKFFISNIPLNMHTIILSRKELPFSIAKLRSKGNLLEISLEELRFKNDEITFLFNDIMNLELKNNDIKKLEDKTEGWIVGLQMAANFMINNPNRLAFIAEFSGNNKYIFDYLAEEVLNSQEEEIKNFLIKTSVLDNLTASACNAVLCINCSQNILEYVEKSNLFIIPLDYNRQWYRYHHLFLDFLRNKLKRDYPETIFDLHKKAGNWYEENSYIESAIFHYLKAKDYVSAVRLIEDIGHKMIMNSEFITLNNWLRLLGNNLICENPNLCMLCVWMHLTTYNLDEMSNYLKQVTLLIQNNDYNEQTSRQLFTEYYSLLSITSAYLGNTSVSIEFSKKALAMIGDDYYLKSIIMAAQAYVSLKLGDKNGIDYYFYEALNFSIKSGNTYVAVLSAKILGHMLILAGKLKKAETMYLGTIKYVEERVGRIIPTIGILYIGLSDIYFEWNRLETSEEYLYKAIELGKQSKLYEILFDSYQILAKIFQSRNECKAAQKSLDKAFKIGQKYKIIFENSHYDLNKSNLYLLQGNSEIAEKWIAELGINKNTEITGFSSHDYIVLARLLLIKGQFDDTLSLLDKIYKITNKENILSQTIDVLVLEASILKKKGNLKECNETLKHAIVLASDGQFIQTFLQEGKELYNLIIQIKNNLIAENANNILLLEYVEKLLNSFQNKYDCDSSKINLLVEPISERELEILKSLSKGKSNKEIAAELFISLNTVKSHIINIYGKLGVHSRTQAILKASEFNILS